MPTYTYQDCPVKLLNETVSKSLGIVVCIPCFNEPNIEEVLLSLANCDQPDCDVEIIVLINESDETDSDIVHQNARSYTQIKEFNTPSWIKLLPVYVSEIPVKQAGVGLARKLVLDEAASRLELSSTKLNVLACYDADSTCSKNYLTGLETFFTHTNKEAVSIHFEHQAADLFGTEEQQAIFLYELHLRYFIQMQSLANLPFAYHTVGSSMACTLKGYRRIGGMNKRKAGEDFYFLQKFIKNDACDRLNTITIYPSSRSSDRVPFGTGRAVLKMKAQGVTLKTYHYQSFIDLKSFVELSDSLFACPDLDAAFNDLPPSVLNFLMESKLNIKIAKLINNTSSQETFRKALYQLFDAFQLVKYLHFVRDNYYPDDNVLTLAKTALALFDQSNVEEQQLLHAYRMMNLSL